MKATCWTDLFEYDADCGALRWKIHRPKRPVGSIAGCVNSNGRYITMHATLNGIKKRYSAHRIIWEIVNGPIPDHLCIDHIDGNGLNNMISNLRVVTRILNQRNRKLSKINKIGISGVYPHSGGYSVYCANKYIKFTKDFFNACCIRRASEIKYGYHPNQDRA